MRSTQDNDNKRKFFILHPPFPSLNITVVHPYIMSPTSHESSAK